MTSFLTKVFQELFNNEFSPLRTKLKFGKLESELCVHPRPPGIQSNRDIFEILGIVNISDLAHPPLESRHLVQEGFHFRCLNIEGIYVDFPMSITLFSNHLK